MFSKLACTAALLAILPSILAAPLQPLVPLKGRDSSSHNIAPPSSNSRRAVQPQRRSTPSKRWDSPYWDDSQPTLTGYLAVEDVDNKFVGYLASSLDEGGILLANFTDSTEGLTAYTFINSGCSISNFTLGVVSDSDITEANPFVAAVEGYYNSGEGDLGGGSANYAYQTLSSDIIPNGPPQVGGNLIDTHYGIGLTQENQIFQYDCSYGGLSASWVDDSGNNIPASYVASQGYFLLTGNAEEFLSIFGGNQYFINFYPITPSSD